MSHEPLRLAVLADFLEEGWPSMDLCAEMLFAHLPRLSVSPELVRARFRRFVSRLPLLPQRAAFNADRLLNRFIGFPRFVKSRRSEFDAHHVVDHTYAQLVHALPAGRTGVYCHDLDAFRCLLEPTRDPRPRWFRGLARRILSGMQKAAVVFHSTDAVRGEIERHGLVESARLVHAPYGVSPEFHADGFKETHAAPFLLHVGSNIPRKRVDRVLATLAGVRRHLPSTRLVKIGAPFTPEQQAIIDRENLSGAIDRREGLSRSAVATLYRGAAAVLLPSDAEGFGLPVIEALACGAPVLASDLPVLREVGGSAVLYLPPDNIDAWVETACGAIERPQELPDRSLRIERAARFSWTNHAQIITEAYQRLAA